MGYLSAICLIALGVWAGWMSFVGSLGESLCDSGDCSGPSDKPELLLVMTIVSFLAAGIAGRLAWRKENRGTTAANRDGMGSTLFLVLSAATIGLLVGIGAILLTPGA